jgi:hypothetical protein
VSAGTPLLLYTEVSPVQRRAVGGERRKRGLYIVETLLN